MMLTTRLLIWGAALATAAAPALARSKDDEIVTFHVEIGRNGEVIGEADLRVGREDSSSFERTWPVAATPTCTDRFGDLRHAAANNSIRVQLEIVRDPERRNARPEYVRAYGQWSEALGVNDGGETSECSNFPLHWALASVTRVIPLDLAEPITLQGDASLFVRISRR